MSLDRSQKHGSALAPGEHRRAEPQAPGRSALSEGDDAGPEHGHRAQGSLFAGALPWASSDVEAPPHHHEHEGHGDEHEEAEDDHEDADVEQPGIIDELDAQADDSAQEQAKPPEHDDLPVDHATRAELPHREHAEQMFGASFAGVQAHTGANLSSLGAKAAAKGETVAFEDANPSRELVAHEMTHVMQQRKAGGAGGRGIASEQSGAEREAEEVEGKASSGGRVSVGAAPGGAIHLKRKSNYAPTDAYNKKQSSGRPLVKVAGKHNFHVSVATQRWSFITGEGVKPFDILQPGTDKNHVITVNVSQPRSLRLPDGAVHKCVLSRTRMGGSAWIPVEALDASETKLLAAAKHAAGKSAPAAPKGKLRERAFRPHTKPNDFSLTPNHKYQSRAQYDHYLHRETKQVTDGFYNVCMALPQPHKVPTAIDVARPGDHFFVMHTLPVALYKNDGGPKAVKHSHWAFGCMGKVDANGKWQPDKSRRGWVPLEALT